jgi:hypothetical protein
MHGVSPYPSPLEAAQQVSPTGLNTSSNGRFMGRCIIVCLCPRPLKGRKMRVLDTYAHVLAGEQTLDSKVVVLGETGYLRTLEEPVPGTDHTRPALPSLGGALGADPARRLGSRGTAGLAGAFLGTSAGGDGDPEGAPRAHSRSLGDSINTTAPPLFASGDGRGREPGMRADPRAHPRRTKARGRAVGGDREVFPTLRLACDDLARLMYAGG